MMIVRSGYACEAEKLLFFDDLLNQAAPGRLILNFEDSGPGVPEESLDHLFDRLYRVDKARSRAQACFPEKMAWKSAGRLGSFRRFPSS
jgi:signal transduction histidine kinase